MKKILLTVLGCVAMVVVSKAQDPNFSQFFASPLTLNPALTGKFDGVIRVAGNYRNQWPSISNAFNTYTVSADMGILQNRIPEGDQFGVGLIGFSDKAGDGVLVTNHVGLSVAYHKSLDENFNHQIGAGFQGMYTNKRLDVSRLKFGDMLTPFGFTGISQETLVGQGNQALHYFDLNAGVFYNGSTDGYNNFYLGASMYHINRPKESFNGANFILNPRTTIQAGGKIPLGSSYNYLHLAANHSMQAKANNTSVGGAVSVNVNNDEDNPTNVYLGSWYRFGDAVIPYMGLEFGEFRFGASYDVNISKLKAASNARGGVEISLIYIRKYVDPNMRKLNCPRF